MSDANQKKGHDRRTIQEVVDYLIAKHGTNNPQIGKWYQVPVNLWKNWWQYCAGYFPKHLQCDAWTEAILNELAKRQTKLQYFTHPKWIAQGPWDAGSPWSDSSGKPGDYEQQFSPIGHNFCRFYNPSTGEYLEIDIWKRGREILEGKSKGVDSRLVGP